MRWWQRVADVRVANSDHIGEEERQALADSRRTATLQVRNDLGIEFAVFEAAHASGIDSADKDPDACVEAHTS